MNGIEFLLDTNFILGLLTSNPDVLDAVQSRTLRTSQAAYSVITPMELLGFIAATALEAGIELPTLDQGLAKVVRSASTARRPGS